MFKKTIIFLIILLPLTAFSQSFWKDFSLTGHVQNMQMVWVQDAGGNWPASNTTGNRLDLHYYPNNNAEVHIGMRNNFQFGSMLYDNYPLYNQALLVDEGYVDMSWQIAGDSSYLLYTNFDRVNLNLNIGNFQFVAGRQRINWGINLVWNPNDIFNTFNYFDFDYVERPGCDALRVQYYTGSTSSVQLAYKLDHDKEATFAGMYKFNHFGYDIQVLSGFMPDDWVAGMGWSGQIGGAGFNGEFSYFIPRENTPEDNENVLIGSIGINYTLPNSLYLHASWLYNSVGLTGKTGRTNIFGLGESLTVKTLSPARHQLFGEVTYPFTPLIKGMFSCILNPGDMSLFYSPGVDISLKENLDLLFTGQIFSGETGSEFGGYGGMYYLRFKYSF